MLASPIVLFALRVRFLIHLTFTTHSFICYVLAVLGAQRLENNEIFLYIKFTKMNGKIFA